MSKDFETSFAGIFADEGYWIDADGKTVEIEEMGPKYKRNVIRHIIKAIKCCGYRSESTTGILSFKDKDYDQNIADKLEELGVDVFFNKEDQSFSFDVTPYE